MAKKLTPQTRVRRMMETMTQEVIGDVLGLSKRQVQRIARGEASGKSVEPALIEFGKMGKRAKAAVIAGDLTLPSKRTPRPKKTAPVEEPPAPTPQAEPIAPSLPRSVHVSLRGNLGPSRDPDYLRRRTISKTLRGVQAARFAELWDGDERGQARALRYFVSAYFGAHGEGHLESIIGKPSVTYGGG